MKRFLVLLMTATIAICSTIVSFAGEWKQEGSNWWYQNDDGSYPVSSWKEVNGKQYYFDANGYMLHDTTTPDGYKVGSDGTWIQEESEAVTSIKIPDATGYGSIKGNVTWQYNRYVGTKADVGAVVYLIPLDFSIKGGGNDELALFLNTKGNNRVYYSKVDGFGQYTFDNIPAGKYRIFIKSKNTKSYLRFEEESDWEDIVDAMMGNILTNKELEKFKIMLGYNSFYSEVIDIEDSKANTVSHDFGYTYM